MAIGSLQHYNRIINITLYDAEGKTVIIECPKRGRKPAIEMNGSFTTDSYLPAFNVTVKNLYLNMTSRLWSTIELEAGYEGCVIPIKGQILSMYQESPGPEGTTVIQCIQGEAKSWLDATIQADFPVNTNLYKILTTFKSKLGIKRLRASKVAAFTIPIQYQHDGSARDGLKKLEKMFEDKKLCIFVRNDELCAICLGDDDCIRVHKLEYISAPPQENTGGSDGTYYTTVTAPWDPKIQKGDKLQIPSRVYVRNYNLVGNISGTQNIQVTALSFHFSTTGKANSMTIQGFLV